MMTIALLAQRRGITGTNGSRLSRSVMISAGIFCVAFVLLAFLMPVRDRVVNVIELPERSVALIQAKALPEPPPTREASRPALRQMAVERVADALPAHPPDHLDLPAPHTHREEAPVNPDAGQLGRERARAATAQLASASDPMDKALDNLAAALGQRADGVPEPSHRRRDRGIAGGRGASELGSVDPGAAGSGRADLERSGVHDGPVSIGSLAPARAADGDGQDGGAADGSAAPGVYRSNASLLAVIQRYAAGIQFCYGNELKRDPTLRGKLVVSLTVAPSGEVSEAAVVQNTLGSDRLASCALAQIRDWRFPAIPVGVTTFQVPFVFTPPN
jgi:TonB family protein